MKYYVVSDVHSFFTEFFSALEKQGFFSDTQPHKLIICGDLFDRGNEPERMQEFVLSLPQDDLILIKGNHEDLMINLLNGWENQSYLQPHHLHNGTVETVMDLTHSHFSELDEHPQKILAKMLQTPFIQDIIPRMVNYYETKNYIFVHGWIPCVIEQDPITNNKSYSPLHNWRDTSPEDWYWARWTNGMDAHSKGILEPNKTIVCGHWHTSYGHSRIEKKGPEFSPKADFSPYYADGIIAIDACTAFSGKVNCIVIEDEEVKNESKG